MKKALVLFVSIAMLAACNSNDNDGTGTGPRSTDEDTTAVNVHNVENANGNMPDTSNSINIGTETEGRVDSSKR